MRIKLNIKYPNNVSSQTNSLNYKSMDPSIYCFIDTFDTITIINQFLYYLNAESLLQLIKTNKKFNNMNKLIYKLVIQEIWNDYIRKKRWILFDGLDYFLNKNDMYIFNVIKNNKKIRENKQIIKLCKNMNYTIDLYKLNEITNTNYHFDV